MGSAVSPEEERRATAPESTRAARSARLAWDIAPRTGHFPSLDGLRGLAVSFVFFYHCVIFPAWREPFTIGWCGIELFFVLSGFLITGLIVDTRGEPHALRNFWVRRALRIVPLYYVALAYLYLSLAHAGGPKAAHALSEQPWFWLYAQNLFMAFHGWYDPLTFTHFWSLAIEVQYYFLWPLVLLAVGPRYALAACAVVGLGSAVLRNVLPVTFPFSYLATFTHLEGLMVGSAMALLLRSRRELLGCWAPRAFVAGGVGLVALALMRHGLHVSDPWVMRLGYSFYALLFGGLLASVLDTGRVGRFARGVFERPGIVFVGKYSYGIFVTHWIVHLETKKPLLDWIVPAVHPAWLAYTLVLLVQAALTMTLSLLAYHLVEERFLRLKDVLAPRARNPRGA
jgi:peptidoglycan/LPS O-acetylase OafA/YrhL